MQAGCRGAHGPFVGSEDGLVILHVFRSGLFLHPFRNIGLTEGEEGFLKVFVGSVEEKTEGSAAGRGVVNHFRHHGLVFSEIQLVADADFAGGIHDDIPQALLPVEFTQQEHHDIGPGLFFLSIETGGENLGIVEDKDVALAEIVDNIFEQAVLDLTAVPVKDHQTGLVSPAGRFLGNTVLGKIEVEL